MRLNWEMIFPGVEKYISLNVVIIWKYYSLCFTFIHTRLMFHDNFIFSVLFPDWATRFILLTFIWWNLHCDKRCIFITLKFVTWLTNIPVFNTWQLLYLFFLFFGRLIHTTSHILVPVWSALGMLVTHMW